VKSVKRVIFPILIFFIFMGYLRANSLEVPAIGRWGNSQCCSVAVSGDLIFLGLNSELRILDASDPIHPVKLGSVSVPDNVLSVFVLGNRAYFAAGNSGLLIVDVSNPEFPTILGTADTPGSAQGVFVSGSYAYVADGASGLRIINVSDPGHPSETGFYDTPGFANGLVVSGNYAYVAHSENSGLRIIDIQNPGSPQEVGFYPTPKGAYNVRLAGNFAFIAADDIEIADVSDPASPKYVGFYETQRSAYDIQVSGSSAFLVEWDNHGGILRILDISDPAHPANKNSLETKGYSMRLALAGNRAAIVNSHYNINFDQGVEIVDISDQDNLASITFYITNAYATDVAVSGSHAFILSRAGLSVIRISDPTHPFQEGYCPLIGTLSIVLSGHFAYITNYDCLVIVNIEDPRNPNCIGTFYGLGGRDISVANNLAFIVYGSRMRVVDISDLYHPFEIGSYTQELYGSDSGYKGVFVSGDYAYVSYSYEYYSSHSISTSGGLLVFDISIPHTPGLVSDTKPLSVGSKLVVAGNYVFLGSGSIIDISDKTQPRTFCYGLGGGDDVAVSGNIACEINRTEVNIYDISDIQAAHRDFYNTSSTWATGVEIAGDYALVTDEYVGLLIIRTKPVSPVVLKVVSPNGGETWPVAANQTIQWEKALVSLSAGPNKVRPLFGDVKIEYSVDNGTTWKSVVESTGDRGWYTWTVPNFPSSQCRVRVTEIANPANSDSSDGAFSIVGIPSIGLSRSQLVFGAIVAQIATEAQTIAIQNNGYGQFDWSATPDQSWIVVNPGSGTGAKLMTVSVNPSGLAAGTYAGNILISVPSAPNSPQLIGVILNVYEAGATAAPFGFVDTPINGLSGVEGSLPMTG
jgi:hypothetical protein